MIKRYFDMHKDDPTRVVRDLHDYSYEVPAYLNAGYIDAGDIDVTGKVTRPSPEDFKMIQDASIASFKRSYDDQKKSGFSDFDRLAATRQWDTLAKGLRNACVMIDDEDGPSRAEAWVKDNPDVVRTMAREVLSHIDPREIYLYRRSINALLWAAGIMDVRL